MLSQQAKRVILAAVMVALAARCASVYPEAIRTRAHVLGLPRDALFRARGLVPVVAYLRDLAPVRVLGQKHDHDRFLYERLAEMLYPIEYMSIDDTQIRAGDLVVLPGDTAFVLAHDRVFTGGELKVLRVQ